MYLERCGSAVPHPASARLTVPPGAERTTTFAWRCALDRGGSRAETIDIALQVLYAHEVLPLACFIARCLGARRRVTSRDSRARRKIERRDARAEERSTTTRRRRCGRDPASPFMSASARQKDLGSGLASEGSLFLGRASSPARCERNGGNRDETLPASFSSPCDGTGSACPSQEHPLRRPFARGNASHRRSARPRRALLRCGAAGCTSRCARRARGAGLDLPTFNATARSAISASSVSPERATLTHE
jgi:hypothetical protein